MHAYAPNVYAPPRELNRAWHRHPIVWVVSIAAAIAVFAFFGHGLMVGYERPLKSGDRALVVAIDDLLSPGDPAADISGALTRHRFIDGTKEVLYELDGEEVYIYCAVTEVRKKQDALAMFHGDKLGGVLVDAFSEAEVKEQPRDDLLSWGDKSYVATVTVDGVPAGLHYLILSGKRVFSLTVYGLTFDDPEAFAAVIRPKLEGMDEGL